MGYYVNPKTTSKEDFLKKLGKRILWSDAIEHEDYTNNLLVVLIDNLFFTAAGICYDQREKEAFMEPDDNRPKEYYLVGMEHLKEFM
jgi:hypothetical protein